MGFMSGIQARVLFHMPSTAVCWSVYEFFKHFLTNYRNEGDGALDTVVTTVEASVSAQNPVSKMASPV